MGTQKQNSGKEQELGLLAWLAVILVQQAGTQRTTGSFQSTPKLATKNLAIAVKLAKENYGLHSQLLDEIV